jgi:hypothetical protein
LGEGERKGKREREGGEKRQRRNEGGMRGSTSQNFLLLVPQKLRKRNQVGHAVDVLHKGRNKGGTRRRDKRNEGGTRGNLPAKITMVYCFLSLKSSAKEIKWGTLWMCSRATFTIPSIWALSSSTCMPSFLGRVSGGRRGGGRGRGKRRREEEGRGGKKKGEEGQGGEARERKEWRREEKNLCSFFLLGANVDQEGGNFEGNVIQGVIHLNTWEISKNKKKKLPGDSKQFLDRAHFYGSEFQKNWRNFCSGQEIGGFFFPGQESTIPGSNPASGQKSGIRIPIYGGCLKKS